MAATLAASEGVPLMKADFVLEGGSVHTDGEGYALHCFVFEYTPATLLPVYVRDAVHRRNHGHA